MARDAEDNVRVARILGSLGSYYLKAGDFDLSERHLLRARDLARVDQDPGPARGSGRPRLTLP